MRRSIPALALAVLLVLAGCSAPVATDAPRTDAPDADTSTVAPETTAPDPTTTAAETTTQQPTTESPTPDADDVDVPVTGGDLPVDVDRIYARVQALTGLTADAPVVEVQELRNRSGTAGGTPFQDALGLTGGTLDDVGCGSIAQASAGGSRVSIATEGLTDAEIELVLAHEFVHVLQANNDLRIRSDRRVREAFTVRRALTEGGAVYVANEYAKQYDLTWGSGDRPLDLRRCFYEQSPDGLRTLAGVYYFGGAYFDATLDDPRSLATVYEDPPETTEELLHARAAGTDPSVPLSVDATTDDWQVEFRGAYGELHTRNALATELDASRAAAGADGWGNDTVVGFSREDRTGFVWVHAWDDADEAAEFADAAEAYATASDGDVRVRRVDARTTALVLGDESFVAGVTVEESNDTVTVTV